MQPVIYADLRCLQDIGYQRRGIGYHSAELLRTRRNSPFANWKTIGLTDPAMAEIPADLLDVVDEITYSVNPSFNTAPAIFIDPSPMTHDSRFSLRLQNHARVVNAAVIYDFIPFDWPVYLPTAASRIEYIAKLARLKKFGYFFPISRYSARRLSELAGISDDRMNVTGACVRTSLYEAKHELRDVPSPYEVAEPYFVFLGGDDGRKNADTAIEGVKRLNLRYGKRIPLKIIGSYTKGSKEFLFRVAGHEEGKGFLEFSSFIPDSEVAALHTSAIAAICPSRIEGFSLPVAEAAVCGCPAVASTCAAHMELVHQREALFHAEDDKELADKLDAILNNPALRQSLVAAQAHLARDFHVAQVGKRLWSFLENVAELKEPRNTCGARPHLALLSAYSPDPALASFYTVHLIEANGGAFTADLFSDSPRPLFYGARFRDASTVSSAPLLDGRYAAVVSVLDSTSGQARTLDFVEQYGGPCLLHDLRLLPVQLERLGPDRLREFASKVRGRPVSFEQLQKWIEEPNPAALFLQNLIRRAQPLIVQTPAQKQLLEKHYAVTAQHMTCCPKVQFERDELTPSARQSARSRLGLSPDVFIISVFRAATGRPLETAILAVELLRSWNLPAELYFLGDTNVERPNITRISSLFDISAYVHSGTQFEGNEIYRQFLIASDAALELRDYALGKEPPELVDCIAAGLRAVATQDMALAAESPEYVRTVPDHFSPLQVAEQLALLCDSPPEHDATERARLAYTGAHNFQQYAKRLLRILELQ